MSLPKKQFTVYGPSSDAQSGLGTTITPIRSVNQINLNGSRFTLYDVKQNLYKDIEYLELAGVYLTSRQTLLDCFTEAKNIYCTFNNDYFFPEGTIHTQLGLQNQTTQYGALLNGESYVCTIISGTGAFLNAKGTVRVIRTKTEPAITTYEFFIN